VTIDITADTPLSIEINLDGQKALLRLDGGTWQLTRETGTRWIAGPRIVWPEALKRSLIEMGAH
jgi:hypothetical protein